MKNINANIIKESRGDKIFNIINMIFMIMLCFLVVYPLYFVVIASVSDPNAVYEGRVVWLPQDASFDGYKELFKDTSIWSGYLNTIIYTVAGTVISVFCTICGAYALSRKTLPFGKFFMFMITFTMFFSGGLIPTYLTIQSLGMLDTVWAIIIPTAIGPWFFIIARTFFQTSIPNDLYEAAHIDGCNEFKLFIDIVLPLSSTIIAVMVLFYGVNMWNSYFLPMIYLSDEERFPLQLVLRNLLIQNELSASMMTGDATSFVEQQRVADQIKYGAIIVSTLPILIIYPFVQKHFAKGVMVGSVKG